MEVLVRLGVVLVLIGVAAAFGWWWNRRSGSVREVRGGGFGPEQLREVGLTREGVEAYALLLGSPTCAPCATVKRILGEVADERPDFAWVYADAGEHLALAKDHHVMRVPTLFVLDPQGRILARTSGVPGKRDLVRVLDREGDLTAV